MTSKPYEGRDVGDRNVLAADIAQLWSTYNLQRGPWLDQVAELRNYLFAVTTDDTAVGETTDWSNTVTIPKIMQIGDNLHANYMSAMFPNDNWLKWESYTNEKDIARKRTAIQGYMANKTRLANFRQTVSQLVWDYIYTGNAIYDVEYSNEVFIDDATGDTMQGYIGPKLIRINPTAIVFDPTASMFRDTPKVVRSLHSVGALTSKMKNEAEQGWIEGVLVEMDNFRKAVVQSTVDDRNAQEAFDIDGFGNLASYAMSGQVEVLEFEGDIYDKATETLLENQLITIVDRSFIARQVQNPSWKKRSSKGKVSWRDREFNLWGMGPLDNLAGMQHAIDKLNNGKLDAIDLSIFPPIITTGDVPPDSVDLRPKGHIHIPGAGTVTIPRPDLSAIQANAEIQYLMDLMEQMAGAPREAMGIRTPGEKTAFEVGTLASAASRIFQEKVDKFELEVLEPALNDMLEIARRNIDGTETIRVLDDDLKAEEFLLITKEDIISSGKLRPIGSRHFAQDAQTLQSLNLILNSTIGQLVLPHVSGKNLGKAVEALTKTERFEIFRDNAAVFEAGETQRLIREDQVAQNAESGIPPTPEGEVEDEQPLQ